MSACGGAEIFCSIGALPALTLTRPISTMHTAKTQSVRQPQRNRFLLRPIAYYRHYGPAAWIDPVVLRSITVSWNNIIIPGSGPYYGTPDDKPHPGFTTDFASRAGAAALNVPRLHSPRAVPRANATVIILMPLPPCHTQPRPNSDIRRRSTSRRCLVYIGHQRRLIRNVSFYEGRPMASRPS